MTAVDDQLDALIAAREALKHDDALNSQLARAIDEFMLEFVS